MRALNPAEFLALIDLQIYCQIILKSEVTFSYSFFVTFISNRLLSPAEGCGSCIYREAQDFRAHY